MTERIWRQRISALTIAIEVLWLITTILAAMNNSLIGDTDFHAEYLIST